MRRGPRLPLEALAPYLIADCRLPIADSRPGATEGGPPAAPSSPQSATDNPQWLDWRAVFGNDHPVEMEVGFGKGLFLLTAAQARPEVNFVGVEIERKYQLLAATRMARRGLANVRLAWADARLFLPRRVPPGSLRALHVYFPDPWWKKRHQKRRVFTDAFAEQAQRVLGPGGQLHLATDVEEYARTVEAVVAARTALRPLPPPAPSAPAHDLDYLTHFERKFRKEGRPIYRLRWEKPAASS